MPFPVKILIVEDSENDVDLLRLHLKKHALSFDSRVVDDRAGYVAALGESWDIILCDYHLPGFGAPDALAILKENRLETPLIVVSGTVGEEVAVETMRLGASDYIMKGNFVRLLSAIDRAIKERAFQTESRQIENELRKKEDELRQAQKMEAIGQLAGGIAHDFNNIVATILMQAEILVDEVANAPNAERLGNLRSGLNQIVNASERARNLTRQLLGFSRKQILQPRVLGLNTLIANMRGMLRPIIEENIEFRHALAPDLKNVRADPGHVEQIVLNLIVNSRDAMPAGGLLEVATRNEPLDDEFARRYGVKPGDYACIEVRDTGTGISPEAQKRLFEPFFTTKAIGKGTGLGLCTVYGIVKQNHGLIFVESELGRGTLFRVYLPQVDEAVEAPETVRPVTANLSGTETILFVEDEEALKEIVCQVLRKHGYRVETAANGLEALERIRARAKPFDLVITDVVMPEMGGAELAAEVHADDPSVRFLFQSGYIEDTLALNGVRSVRTHFLEKPYAPKTLLAKIREIFGEKAAASA